MGIGVAALAALAAVPAVARFKSRTTRTHRHTHTDTQTHRHTDTHTHSTSTNRIVRFNRIEGAHRRMLEGCFTLTLGLRHNQKTNLVFWFGRSLKGIRLW